MGKRYLIAVDLEGAACVVGTPLPASTAAATTPSPADRPRGKQMPPGALDNGAEEVIIWDNHGQGINLEYEQLDPRCRICLGTGYRSRFPLPEGQL